MRLPLNCLIGMILLCFVVPWKRIVLKRSEYAPVPHFVLLCEDGSYWDFCLCWDIFPDPFCYLMFVGRFRKRSKV